MSTYKWDSPREWLDDKIDQLANQNDVNGLTQILTDLLPNIDNDTIQNIYQDEMDEDGYFEDEDKKDIFRDRIHNWVENETNYLSCFDIDGVRMSHENYLEAQYQTSVDQLFDDHAGDVEEAIAQLS